MKTKSTYGRDCEGKALYSCLGDIQIMLNFRYLDKYSY